MTALELAVEKLYEVFAVYPAPKSPPFGLGWCPNSPEVIAKLLEPSLREIDFHAIQDYAMTAYSDWGDSRDFRYFLPRVFEMLAFHDKKWIDNEFIFLRIAYVEELEVFSTWTQQEQTSVLEFCVAWWENQFSYEYYTTYANLENNLDNRIMFHSRHMDDLRGLLFVFDDPSPLLDHWLNNHSVNPTLNFAGFTMAFFADPETISSRLTWGNKTGAEYASIKAWFLHSPCLEKLQQALIDFKDHPEVSIIAEAIHLLQLETTG